jgi:ATP-dependent DNA helicase RecQ
VDASKPAQALFASVAQTGERFGTAHIIDVTRGAKTARLAQFGHDSLAAHGGGRELGKPYLQALIRQAVSSGFLRLNIAQYGALQLTEKGKEVLAGQAVFMCKDISKAPAKSKSARPSRSSAAAGELSERDGALLGKLKAERMALSRALGKPAYIVFSDASLIDMAKKRPSDKIGMLDVLGVGETKFNRFGPQFLTVIENES